MMIQQKLTALLQKEFSAIGADDLPFTVDYSSDTKYGDYSTNAALIAAKKLGKNPMELGEEIAKKLQSASDMKKIEIARPGFINFWIKDDVLINSLICLAKPLALKTSLSGEKLLVEFAHPNTHKEMHIGHMRTLITGEAISRLAESTGATVFRANYQGDIGPHVAKALFGMQKIMEKEGLAFEEIKRWANKDKAHFLGRGYSEGVKLYTPKWFQQEIDEINAFLYQRCSGETVTSSLTKEEQEKLWNLYQETHHWSLSYYADFYRRFYTTFNNLFLESQMVADGKRIVNEYVGEVFEKSEKTIIFSGEKYGLHTRVFITAKGNPTYEGKEMANAFAEYKAFAFDKKIHVVANEQAGYFKVVFKALELIDPKKFENKQYHLSMGMVQLKDRKMSSRTGDVLTVDWLLDQIKERVNRIVEDGRISADEREATIEKIVIGAVKYSVLKVGTGQDAAFDIETSVSLDGKSGPYLQYVYARTQSVLRKAKNEKQKEQNGLQLQDEERDLLRLLARFSEVVEDAAQHFTPNTLCTYLFELAQAFNLFYQKQPILKAEDAVRDFRLSLTSATGQAIKQGLYLLGIQTPEKM